MNFLSKDYQLPIYFDSKFEPSTEKDNAFDIILKIGIFYWTSLKIIKRSISEKVFFNIKR
jgi:hypothetical protein